MTENNSNKAYFDRVLGSLVGIPGVTHTKPTTVREMMPLVGNVQTFIVQTYRQKDENEEDAKSRTFIFVEYVDEGGTVRLVIPPKVADVIARQRTSLSDRARSKGAKQAAATRKALGIKPAFLKKARKT